MELLGIGGVMKRRFSFKTRIDLSHCSYCLCNNTNGQATCYKRNLNDGNAVQTCSKCMFMIKKHCSYCEKPGNRSILIPSDHSIDLGNSTECISCNCTQQGTVSCRYKDIQQPICRGTRECETLLETLPKRQCPCCVDPLNGQKKAPLTTWSARIGRDYFKCSCSYRGDLECLAEKKIDQFSYSVQCSGGNCTKLITNPGNCCSLLF